MLLWIGLNSFVLALLAPAFVATILIATITFFPPLSPYQAKIRVEKSLYCLAPETGC
jgi:hypothetical protein